MSDRLRVQEPTTPTYERGDYVKVEFQDETTVIGEWMWVRVHHCDDERQLVFGTLGSQLVNDYGGKVELGSELAVSYSQIREHKKASDFTSKNRGPPSARVKFEAVFSAMTTTSLIHA